MQIVLVAIAVFVGLSVLIGVGCARSIVRPGRTRLWTNPKQEAGLGYEDVSFKARDGTGLKGWFIPAVDAGGEARPAVVIVHGWLWNRLGTRQNNPINDFPGGKAVLLMPLAQALAHAGYHVLMFDLRNHGLSERRGVYTGGWQESLDLLGAVDWLAGRRDVMADRIGVAGFSVGGNILLQALPFTNRIQAGIAVQPADVQGFMTRYYGQAGPLGRYVHWLTQFFYSIGGGPDLKMLHPMYAARGAGHVPVLFVQGTGDKWGGRADVEKMIAATPNASAPLFPETAHRFDGYNWVVQRPELVIDFFREHMPETKPAALVAAGN